MPLKDNYQPGDLFGHTDLNALAGQVNALTDAPIQQKLYRVDDFGADPTGATFSDAAVAAARTAMGDDPGVLVFGIGEYRLSAGLNLENGTSFGLYQGVRGQGAGATRIVYTGEDACFEFRNLDWEFNTASEPSGGIHGMWIYGWENTNSNTYGIRYGDIGRMRVSDVHIAGFNQPGCAGLFGDNHVAWSERGDIECSVEQCTTAFLFQGCMPNGLQSYGTSFDYSRYRLTFVVIPNQDAFVLRSRVGGMATTMNGIDLALTGNCNNAPSGGTNTGTLFRVGRDNDDPAALSGELYVNVETSGYANGVSHFDFSMGDGPYWEVSSRVSAVGSINLIPFSGANFRPGTATPRTFAFAGLLKKSAAFGSTTNSQAFQPLQLLSQARGEYWISDSNAVQMVYVVGASGGTFRLNYNGTWTDPIPYDASFVAVQAALEEIPALTGNVAVVNAQPRFVNSHYSDEIVHGITFTNGLAETAVPTFTVDDSSLTGSAEVGVRRTGSENKTLVARIETGNIIKIEETPGVYRLGLDIGALTDQVGVDRDSPFGLTAVDIWIKQPTTGGNVVLEGPWFTPNALSASTYTFEWFDGIPPVLSTEPDKLDVIRLSTYNFNSWVGQHVTKVVTTPAGSQTLTNKAISLASNTVTGTLSQFNAALTDGDFATLAGAETLTNKTLVSPRVNQILDAGGATVMSFTGASGAAHYVDVASAVAGYPQIRAAGASGTVHLLLTPKGDTATVWITDTSSNRIAQFSKGGGTPVNYVDVRSSASGSPSRILAVGSDTNVGLNLIPQGTGTVQANGVDIVTTTGAQSITNKTLTNPTITSPTGNIVTSIDGASGAVTGIARRVATTSYTGAATNQWTKVLTWTASVAYYSQSLLLTFVSTPGIAVTATVLVQFTNNTAGANPTGSVYITSLGCDPNRIDDNAFKLVGGAYGEPIELWCKQKSYTAFDVYETARYNNGGTLTYLTAAGLQGTEPVGSVINVSTNGVVAGNAPVVTTTATQTLTGKTLTAPVLSGTVTGTYTLGGTPTFPSTVVTTTGTQALTNKTLTSPTITNPTITGTPFIQRSVSTPSAPAVLGSATATDYVVFSKMTEPVALLNCEGSNNSTTFTDSGYLAANWTASGDAKISTAQSKWGNGSAYFDGTGDYLVSTGDVDEFTIGADDFTVECWVRPSVVSGVTQNLVDFRPTNGWYPLLFIDSVGRPAYYVNSVQRITASSALVADTWYHIALCRVSGTARLFVDGVQVGSQYVDSTPLLVDPAGVKVGNAFSGYMQDVRIFNGVGLYSSTFTPPSRLGRSYEDVATADKTVALLHGNGANASTVITDDGVLLSNWTAVGNAKISTAQSKFGGSSVYLDGTGDYITATADASNFAFGTGDFTIEMWLRPSTVAIAGGIFLFDARPASTNGWYPAIFLDATGKPGLWLNSATRIASASALTIDAWQHLALCRESGTTRMFIDGIQVGSSYSDSTALLCASGRPFVGASSHTVSVYPYIGWMDEIRISKGIARYTGNFTPPAAPHPDPPSIRFPSAVANTNDYRIRNIGTETVILAGASGQTFDGTALPTLATNATARYISDGSNWRTV